MGINEYLDNKLCASTDEDNTLYLVIAIDGGTLSKNTLAFRDSDTADKAFKELVRNIDSCLEEDEIEEFLNDGMYSQDGGDWNSIYIKQVKV